MAMNISNNMNVGQMMTRYFDAANATTAKTMQQIASGNRINSAADDAAGLAIGERMNSRITGISMASRNTQDAVSMARVAEGALGNVSEMTNRMSELAVQAGNGTLGSAERAALQAEYDQLSQEINRVGQSTTFNGNKLFDGSNYTMQIGADSGDTLQMKMGTLSADALGLSGVDLTSQEGAGNALEAIKKASETVSSQRGSLGAVENRLQSTFNNLTNTELNLTDSLSKIMDTDIAKQSINMGVSNAMSQVSLAMMGNARNMMEYNVTQLLMR